jgi:YegS/Rv2252/BmrU family lipid kinase
LEFSTELTAGPGDATRLTERALAEGAATVVAVGGDGTANEVANGFFRWEGDHPVPLAPDACFALIPLGTGADLARALGLRGLTVPDVARTFGPSGNTQVIDVGMAAYRGREGQLVHRVFLNSVDLGLGGETVAAIESQTPRVKALGGRITYFLGAVQAIVRHEDHAVRCSLDGGPFEPLRIDTIWVSNGPFTGGGMRVVPSAALDDGLLDVLVLQSVSKRELLLRLLPGVYRGTHLKHPAITHFRARQVRVETDELLLLQMDGEQPGRAPASLEVLPRALRVAVP